MEYILNEVYIYTYKYVFFYYLIDNKTLGIEKTTENCMVEEEQELSNVE